MQFRHEGPTSILDRIFGAVVAFVFVAITLVLLPLYLAVKLWFPTHAQFKVYFALPFWIWVSALSIGSAAVGAMHGTLRAIEFLAHMWGTEQPPDRRLTEQIWGVVIAAALLTFLLALL